MVFREYYKSYRIFKYICIKNGSWKSIRKYFLEPNKICYFTFRDFIKKNSNFLDIKQIRFEDILVLLYSQYYMDKPTNIDIFNAIKDYYTTVTKLRK